MRIDYTTLEFPEIKDKMSGFDYAIMKANVASLMMGQRLDTFEAQASPDGPWEPIKDVDTKLKTVRKDYAKELDEMKSGARTKLSKKSQNMKDKDKILIKTGILRASFTGNGTGVEISEDEIAIFTNLEYAAAMNFGVPKKNIPPRRYDMFTDDQEMDIAQLIQDYLDGE